jgi:hypothetical protein
MQSRPWRVFVLAVLAVVATTATMGEANALLRSASHDRYAVDVIRTQLASLFTAKAPRER